MKTKIWIAGFLLLCFVFSACDDEALYLDDEGAYDNNADSEYDDEEPFNDDYDEAALENEDDDVVTPTADQDSIEPIGTSTDLAEVFGPFVEREMAKQKVPGAAVAVIQGDKVTYAQGFGWRDVDAQLPVTTETLFHIGSTTKSMTAMAIASLVDDGVLDWDTPVVDVYPQFQLAEATDTVTFRHLLSMRGGIPDWAEDDFDIDNGSAEDLLQYVADIELLAEPGGEFSYSNISASLSGYVGGLADGGDVNQLNAAYADLLQSRVLEPIGMQNAAIFYSDAQKSPHYGKSYILDRGEIIEAEPEDWDADPLAPSGVLKADVLDMSLYISTQLNRGVAPNGTRVISEKNMEAMWQPHLEGYALGWEIKKEQRVTSISHEGSFDNYLSVIGFVPELNFGYVILTNSADAGESLIDGAPDFLIDYFLDQ